MKLFNSMFLGAMLVLSACGKGGDGGTAAVPPPNAAVAGQCAAGSVYTTQGCLPQGTCPASFGWNGSTCVQGTANGACAVGSVQTAQGCLVQGQCQVNFGWNGSTCIQGTTNGYNSGYNNDYYGQQQNGYGQNGYYNQQQYGNGYYNQYNNGGYNSGYYNGGYNRNPYAGGGFYIGGRIGWGY